MGDTLVKLCGITRVEDALGAVVLGVAAIGLNFVSESPRAVSVAVAREIAAALPAGVLRVGVFRDAPGESVDAVAAAVGLDCLQLHGAEDPAYCAARLRAVIKVVRPAAGWTPADAEPWAAWPLLVDAWHPAQSGGTGRRADWAAARALVRAGRQVWLAGGLGPDTVAEALQMVGPYALDLNSGVESAPGVKDLKKLRDTLAVVRGGNPLPAAPAPNEERIS